MQALAYTITPSVVELIPSTQFNSEGLWTTATHIAQGFIHSVIHDIGQVLWPLNLI